MGLKTTCITISENLYNEIRERAREKRVKASALYEEAVKQYLLNESK